MRFTTVLIQFMAQSMRFTDILMEFAGFLAHLIQSINLSMQIASFYMQFTIYLVPFKVLFMCYTVFFRQFSAAHFMQFTVLWMRFKNFLLVADCLFPYGVRDLFGVVEGLIDALHCLVYAFLRLFDAVHGKL